MEFRRPSAHLYVLEIGKKCPMINAGLFYMLVYIDDHSRLVLTLNVCLAES